MLLSGHVDHIALLVEAKDSKGRRAIDVAQPKIKTLMMEKQYLLAARTKDYTVSNVLCCIALYCNIHRVV